MTETGKEKHDMDITKVLESPVLLAGITGAVSILSGIVGAAIQRGVGKEVERDRFRHDIACKTTETRLGVHVDLASALAEAYRDKRNCAASAQKKLDDFKNFYYDHRYFFSPQLGTAFRDVVKSLSHERCDPNILEDNVNTFFNAIRDDLLLPELSQSVSRAVAEQRRPRQYARGKQPVGTIPN